LATHGAGRLDRRQIAGFFAPILAKSVAARQTFNEILRDVFKDEVKHSTRSQAQNLLSMRTSRRRLENRALAAALVGALVAILIAGLAIWAISSATSHPPVPSGPVIVEDHSNEGTPPSHGSSVKPKGATQEGSVILSKAKVVAAFASLRQMADPAGETTLR